MSLESEPLDPLDRGLSVPDAGSDVYDSPDSSLIGERTPGRRRKMLVLYWRRLRRRPVNLAGTVVFLVFVLLAVIGPWIIPYGIAQQDILGRLHGPSAAHIFGTDYVGRDVLSRVIAGTRNVFLIGGIGTLIAVVVGTSIGLLSGYVGGLFDEGCMRLLDVILAFPSLLLALILLSTVGPSNRNLILVVAVVYTPTVARVVRSKVLDVKTRDYVDAARLRGEAKGYILFREILPSTIPTLLVEASMRFSFSIFLVASLGFLGLGVQPPSPDWGLQVNEARTFYSLGPWSLLFPMAAIALLIVATNLMSDGLRNMLQAGMEEG